MSAILRELAEQAVSQPGRLAAVLLPYAQARGWDDTTLASMLGCAIHTLPRLLLARAPGQSPVAQQLESLAREWGADRGRLEAVLTMAYRHADRRD